MTVLTDRRNPGPAEDGDQVTQAPPTPPEQTGDDAAHAVEAAQPEEVPARF
jgi:hypothetical protein